MFANGMQRDPKFISLPVDRCADLTRIKAFDLQGEFWLTCFSFICVINLHFRLNWCSCPQLELRLSNSKHGKFSIKFGASYDE